VAADRQADERADAFDIFGIFYAIYLDAPCLDISCISIAIIAITRINTL